eukprot:sb/3470133/
MCNWYMNISRKFVEPAGNRCHPLWHANKSLPSNLFSQQSRIYRSDDSAEHRQYFDMSPLGMGVSSCGLLCGFPIVQEPTEISKQPIRTRYLGHVNGHRPIRDQYFLIQSVSAIVAVTSLLLFIHFYHHFFPARMPFCFAKRHSRVRIRKRHFGILTNRRAHNNLTPSSNGPMVRFQGRDVRAPLKETCSSAAACYIHNVILRVESSLASVM